MMLKPVGVLLVTLTVSMPAAAQEWRYYGADQGGSRYSRSAQITPENVTDLVVAWTYRTGEPDRYPEHFPRSAFQVTPLLVEGSLIFCTPFSRVIAVDPERGTQRWVFDPEIALDLVVPVHKCRGIAAWTDPLAGPGEPCRTRIVLGLPDLRIAAIDARTGLPCSEFGNDGEVPIAPNDEHVVKGEVTIASPPVIVNEVAIFGSGVTDSLRADAPSGMVRAFDVRTGAPVWTFDPIPRDRAKAAVADWKGDSARGAGAANVWAPMAADEDRDLVFLPTGSPSPDFYGGLRPGDNRHSDSLVALRASTGERVWHFQITHHDVWDFDVPSQPMLVDIHRDGSSIPAVVQGTKQGLVFVFDRETGEPLFPIEERPVPQNAVRGEHLSPTQPFPTLPEPLMPQEITPDDAWGFTYLDRKACRRMIEDLEHGPIYTPPTERGTAMLPGFTGGMNWGSASYDPDRGLLIVPTTRVPTVARLVARDTDVAARAVDPEFDEAFWFPQEGTPYGLLASFLVSPLGAPCTSPPWGGLTAIDLASGETRWDVPLGTIEKLAPLPIPLRLGTPVSGGPISTAGGVTFIGATMDDRFRAFETGTGKQLWSVRLPAGGQATPMTYEAGGRQYVVIAAGGHGFYGTTPGDYVIAYALPD